MAYREVAMWEILSVLERIGRGDKQAAVARLTGHGRKTIRGYIRTARELGWDSGGEAPTETLAAAVRGEDAVIAVEVVTRRSTRRLRTSSRAHQHHVGRGACGNGTSLAGRGGSGPA